MEYRNSLVKDQGRSIILHTNLFSWQAHSPPPTAWAIKKAFKAKRKSLPLPLPAAPLQHSNGGSRRRSRRKPPLLPSSSSSSTSFCSRRSLAISCPPISSSLGAGASGDGGLVVVLFLDGGRVHLGGGRGGILPGGLPPSVPAAPGVSFREPLLHHRPPSGCLLRVRLPGHGHPQAPVAVVTVAVAGAAADTPGWDDVRHQQNPSSSGWSNYYKKLTYYVCVY